MKSSKNKSSQFPKENRLPMGLIKSQSSSKESENKESSDQNDLLMVRGQQRLNIITEEDAEFSLMHTPNPSKSTVKEDSVDP